MRCFRLQPEGVCINQNLQQCGFFMLKFKDIRKISGWLAWQDYCIIRDVIAFQNEERTAVLEIGVHHGKSFVPLAHFSGERKLYAIDIFGRQDLNTDRSGHGDKSAFLGNLRAFGVDESRITIDERLSSDVSASDVLSAVGPVGFFHIDGGHHLAAVNSDLELALQTVAPSGVVAIDDTYRPEWPEVTQAVFAKVEFQREFRQFAIGFNKSYWCRPDFVHRYQAILRGDADLSVFLRKTYAMNGGDLPIYQDYPLPEWNAVRMARWFTRLRFPGLSMRLEGSRAVRSLVALLRRLQRAVSR